MSSHFTILAIETSCDETAISILRVAKNSLQNSLLLQEALLANEISSQVKLHAKFGGVVPSLAAREHVKNIPLLFKQALAKADLKIQDIDLIAVTNGPGLIPALMVGVNFTKTIAYLHDKPLIGIHHIEGHIYANFIVDKISAISNDQFPISKKIQNTKFQKNTKQNPPSLIENCELKIENSPNIKFPTLCLVVSGGHTQLVLMQDHLDYKIIGQTLDDAAGEAFDKVARILNIGYPGGPAVARCAAQVKSEKLKVESNSEYEIQNTLARQADFEFRKEPISGIQNLKIDSKFKIQNSKFEIHLPRPMLNRKNFDFSFSGLKTAVLYETKKNPGLLSDKNYIAAVCHEFQQAVIEVLIHKTLKAAEQYKPKTIMLAGGVSANKELREQLGEAILNSLPTSTYNLPPLELTGDNAAMIAAAAAFRWQKMSDQQKQEAKSGWQTIQADANLKLKNKTE